MKGLFDWEKPLFETFIKQGETVVVLAAGGGREVFALAKQGCNVRGYEADGKMVASAQRFFRENGMNIQFEKVGYNEVPDNKCDVFVFGWGVYNHFWGRENRIALLQKAKNTLNADGKIIISFWAFSPLAKRRYDLVQRYNCKFFKKNIEYASCLKKNCWGKYYSEKEIAGEAAAAGLRVEFFSSKDYGKAVLGVM
ncbi:MAG: class I SAM-dependent methyltransferase [Dysgonamonadaceae bacterium]|nr:class I SAM-dependent methyltransferase [Dysgonamonadaceae bacterium]